MQTIWQTIAAVVGPMLGAGIAAYLGARLGIGRHKLEKAFEIRLRWFETVIPALLDSARRMQHLSRTARMGFSRELQSTSLDNVLKSLRTLSHCLDLAESYADARSIAAIDLLRRSHGDLLQFQLLDPSDTSKGGTLDLARMEKAVQFTATVVVLLNEELRQHLGLEPQAPRLSRFTPLRKRQLRRMETARKQLETAYQAELKGL